MAQITLWCYMTPEEFRVSVSEVISTHGYRLFVGREPGYRVSEEVGLDELPERFWGLSLVSEVPEDRDFNPIHLPPKWGAAHLRPPKVVGDLLLQCGVGARSDWFENGQLWDDPSSLVIAKTLKKALQKRLVGWCYASFPEIPGAKTSKSAKYSAGALEWVRQGGKLNVGVHDRALTIPDVLMDLRP